MKEKNSGIIIHVIKKMDELKGHSASTAARAGAAAWIEAAAQEFAGFGVKVCLAHNLEQVLEACAK